MTHQHDVVQQEAQEDDVKDGDEVEADNCPVKIHLHSCGVAEYCNFSYL